MADDGGYPGEEELQEDGGRPRPFWHRLIFPVAVTLAAIIAGLSVAAVVIKTSDRSDPRTPTLLETFTGYAEQVGLDRQAWLACIGDPQTVALITDHLRRGVALGVVDTPAFAVNDKLIVGNQPWPAFEEVINAELIGNAPTMPEQYSPLIQQLARQGQFKILPARPDLNGAALRGDPSAPVVVAEFGDFQCPFCKAWLETNRADIQVMAGRGVAFAFLHFPLVAIHPNAGNASAAAVCAARQGKFWEMHDALYAEQKRWESLR